MLHAVLFDGAVHRSQPKAGAFAHPLGGEERFKKMRQRFLVVSARHYFEVGKRNRRYYYDRNQRREAFEEIRAMAEIKLTGRRAADAAWRLAVETWLRREGHMTVSVDGKVFPYYAGFKRP